MAVQYSEKALQAEPGDLVNAFNVGQSYRLAGMNSDKPRSCDYYRKSLEKFEQLKVDPVLQSERGMIEGEQVPMGPYRRALDYEIRLTQTLQSSCKSVS